jgi:hypothetical protein
MKILIRGSLALLMFTVPYLAIADTLGQNTSVQSGAYAGSAAYSGGNNVNFEAGRVQAPLPQFGINNGVMGPPLFTEPTRPASQLYEAYFNAIRSCGPDDGYTTVALSKKKAEGLDVTYNNAIARFSPTNYFILRSQSITGKRYDENLIVKSPIVGTEISIRKGRCIGLVYISTIQGQNTTQADLLSAVQLLTLEKIQPYFPGKQLHLILVPGGSGINIGITSEGTSKGFFSSIGFPMGAASGGVGGNYTTNDGSTRMATTLGNQIMVFVEGEGRPINLSPAPPVQQEQPKANTNVGTTAHEIVVRIQIQTQPSDNQGIQYQEGARRR